MRPMRFVLGLLAGLAALGSYVGYERWSASRNPCGGRCGAGTRCTDGQCIVAEADGKRTGRRRGRRVRRPHRHVRRGASGAAEPALKKATAAQLQPVTRGASLRDPEVIDLASADGPELSSEEIERRFRTLDRPIAACIQRAREGYDVTGRVAISFRIERSGAIQKWQLKAPALLVQRGLQGCLDPLLRGLRFGRSARAVIMNYPYQID